MCLLLLICTTTTTTTTTCNGRTPLSTSHRRRRFIRRDGHGNQRVVVVDPTVRRLPGTRRPRAVPDPSRHGKVHSERRRGLHRRL